MLEEHPDITTSSVGRREIQLFIVSPRALIRDAFERLVACYNIVVVGKGKSFADLADNQEQALEPDLVLGVFDSDQETSEALLQDLRSARASLATAKVIVLTASMSPEVLRAAVESGVEAILTTDISPVVLQRTVELVHLGQRLLPAEMAGLLDAAAVRLEARQSMSVLDVAPHVSPDRKRATALSPREHEILQQLVNGCSNKVIARELNITEATVKVHIKALLRKTQMANRTQAAIWALNTQLFGQKTGTIAPGHDTTTGHDHPLQLERLLDASEIRVESTTPIDFAE